MSDALHLEREAIARPLRGSLSVGIIAAILCVPAALFDIEQFFRAYYVAWLFFLGLSLGSLALAMIQHLTGGAWTLLTRRLVEAQLKTLPLMALLAIPLVLGLPHIFLWAQPEAANPAPGESYQAWYLGLRFFYLRAGVYFAVWLVLAAMMNHFSRQLDNTNDALAVWRPYKVSGLGLVLFGVTLHFATIDWVMSLQPGFTSTMLGPLVFSGQLISAYALAVILFCCVIDRPQFAELLSDKVLNDLSSLLFTLAVLWAYLSWFDFMLIWIADLPRGNLWYTARSQGYWPTLFCVAGLGHFVIPFFLLQWRSIKENRLWLRRLATIILVSHVLVQYYQVMPVYGQWELSRHWLDPLPLLAIGGIWFASLLWLLTRRPLLPHCDLNYTQARRLHALDNAELARTEAANHA
ncbi:MAG: hypothetical protein U0805_05315 [Pirellulales bacterium]